MTDRAESTKLDVDSLEKYSRTLSEPAGATDTESVNLRNGASEHLKQRNKQKSLQAREISTPDHLPAGRPERASGRSFWTIRRPISDRCHISRKVALGATPRGKARKSLRAFIFYDSDTFFGPLPHFQEFHLESLCASVSLTIFARSRWCRPLVGPRRVARSVNNPPRPSGPARRVRQSN